MREHYDFAKSVKNPYLAKAKKQLPMRLDEDTIKYFGSSGLSVGKNGVSIKRRGLFS